MTARATGTLGRFDGVDAVVFERRFDTSVEDVWDAVTDPDRLGRWIGTWTGDPASGAVRFRMTAEGEDVPESTVRIERCEPPHLLRVVATDEYGTWDLVLRVAPDGDGALLTFHHLVLDPAALEGTGPGWEYYLDRLVAVESGGSPDLDWDGQYYPALAAHYAGLARRLTPGSAPGPT
jgi:uncharacterized protein YndB with AHSA1/START domain